MWKTELIGIAGNQYNRYYPGMVYHCLHGTAPSYLAGSLCRTSDVVCVLLTQPCWWYRPPDVQHSVTVPSKWLRHVQSLCMEQPAIVCRECPIAEDVPSRAEDCTCSVVIWRWLGDCDCTAQYNCCLPATTDCRRFCTFCFVSFCTVPLQCLWHDSVTLISTLLLAYLFTQISG